MKGEREKPKRRTDPAIVLKVRDHSKFALAMALFSFVNAVQAAPTNAATKGRMKALSGYGYNSVRGDPSKGFFG
jgi:hypothetical protein